MRRIEEQIQWYKQNSNSLYDDMVSIELEKINSLYNRYQDHTNEIFVEEIIESFCKIIEKQRDKICALKTEEENNNITSKDFQNDKMLQDAFTKYCLSNGQSSYTVNDYCSRIRNLWKSFYDEYQQSNLPEELELVEEKIQLDCPLLNAYHHVDEVHCFISMKIASTNGNRNWINARAAFNKLDEFKSTILQ